MKPEKGTFLSAVRDLHGLGTTDALSAHVIVSGAPRGLEKRLRGQHIIETELTDLGIQTTIERTRSGEHAKKLTKDALHEGADIVVYYSGDGGLHTGVDTQRKMLLNPDLVDKNGNPLKQPVTLFVPGGTQNIGARALGTPLGNVQKAMDSLLTGELRKSDLIEMIAGDQTEHCVMIGGFGAAAQVTEFVDATPQRGPSQYLKQSFTRRNEIKPRDVYITNNVGDVYEIPVWIGEVMTGGPYGGWYSTLPHDARLDDGKIDMFAVVPRRSFFRDAIELAHSTGMRKIFPSLLLPDHVRTMRGSRLTVETADGKGFGAIHFDGDGAHTNVSKLIFQAEKHALHQLVPKQGKGSLYILEH